MPQQHASINDSLRSMARERLDFWRLGETDLTTTSLAQDAFTRERLEQLDTHFQHVVAMKQKEMRALGSEYNEALTIDEVHRTVTLTGHWWYQGVHTVHPHPKGSQVTYKVNNIARVARTLAFLQRPFYRKQMRQDLEQMFNQICSDIGCTFLIEHE